MKSYIHKHLIKSTQLNSTQHDSVQLYCTAVLYFILFCSMEEYRGVFSDNTHIYLGIYII